MKVFKDLTQLPGTEGREDTQGCWQTYFADYIGKSNETLLDVGAGLGLSKERLSKNGLAVTTQDPGPGLAVDLTEDMGDIPDKSYSIVTAFDVIEHVPFVWQKYFIYHCARIARHLVFLTTPNMAHTKGTHVYHAHELYPKEFLELMETEGTCKTGFMMVPDEGIIEVSSDDFIGNRFCYNMGLLIRV